MRLDESVDLELALLLSVTWVSQFGLKPQAKYYSISSTASTTNAMISLMVQKHPQISFAFTCQLYKRKHSLIVLTPTTN